MIITLSPQRRDDTLSVTKSGDTLTINGESFDFSVIPDGTTLPASAVDCEYIVGNIDRVDGELNLTLLLPIGPNASNAAKYPQPIDGPADGALELPQ